MEDSTSIADLPNPAFGGGGGGGGGVVQPAAAPMVQQQQQQAMPPPQAPAGAPQQQQVIDPKYMNYIITGIQQTGGTTLGTLPSRDIPMNTLEIQQDEYIRANYVPPPPSHEKHVGFVEDYERRHSAPSPKTKKAAAAAAVEKNAPLFEDYYFPILAALLYFIFQMPAFSHTMFKYLKFIHTADGNLTNVGVLVKTALFGAILCSWVYIGMFS